MEELIAKRYVKALLATAIPENQREDYNSILSTLSNLLTKALEIL